MTILLRYIDLEGLTGLLCSVLLRLKTRSESSKFQNNYSNRCHGCLLSLSYHRSKEFFTRTPGTVNIRILEGPVFWGQLLFRVERSTE